MITVNTWKTGALNGIKTSLSLLKIIIPVYALVTVLGHTPVIHWLSDLFAPLMNFTGLPGEAAIAFVTGAFVSMYAALGIIAALNLTPFQITTLAVMLNFAHELIVETAVLKKAGISVWAVVFTRLFSAFAVGGLLNALGKNFF
ncbi:MAG: nucleoside recognition domain-containing protein [Pseudomonadota bacterium]